MPRTTLPRRPPSTKPFSVDHMLGPSFFCGGQQVFEFVRNDGAQQGLPALRVLGNLDDDILSKITLKSGVGSDGALHGPQALSLEGVSQIYSILPERLPAAFDLVLRRIRSLKRCAQACGCKIMTPRYACNLAPGCVSNEPTFAGLRKNQKKRKKKGSQKKGSPKKREKGFPLAKVDIA